VVVAGAVVAVGIAAKLVLWPLVVWLAATRRWRQAGIASGGALALLLVGWAAIGFRGLHHYPRLLAADATAFQNRGHSLVAVGIRLGLGVDGARTLAALVALALLASTVYLARRADGDRRAYAAAIGAAVFCSPIVWANYFLLPLVPLAIARPRLSAVWLVPLALWISPSEPAGTGPLLVAVAVVLAIVGLGMERGADARRGLGREAAR
jgi:hypothetical protein